LRFPKCWVSQESGSPSESVSEGGWAFTVRVAALLVALPAELVTTTRNVAPLSAVVVAGAVYEADVAPAILAPFFCHWYVSGAVPVATTVKVAVWPAVTV